MSFSSLGKRGWFVNNATKRTWHRCGDTIGVVDI